MENGTTLEKARNGRMPSGFDRPSASSSKPQLGIGTDFDLGKSAWTTSSRIWGSSNSFLDASADDEPMKPSPVRQTSSSGYVQTKLQPSSLLTPTEVNNENAVQSKLPWSSMSSALGFSSRQRGQPLSPTKQRQNQILDLMANSSNGGFEESSLFAGSAPDVEDVPADPQQQYQHRRAITASARFPHSPTRASALNRTQPDPQIQAFNSSKYTTNGIFPSLHDYSDVQDHPANGLPTMNGMTAKYSLQNGHAPRRPSNGFPNGFPDELSRYDSMALAYGKANGRPLTAERVDQSHPSTDAKYVHEAMNSLRALSFDQARDAPEVLPARRSSIQTQYQRDINSVSTHASSQTGLPFNPMESTLQLASANGQNVGSRLESQTIPHYAGFPYASRGNLSPLSSDHRSGHHSPFYSTAGTPPTGSQSVRSTPASGMSSYTSHNEPSMFERKYANIDSYGFDQPIFAPGALQPQMGNGFPYDVQVPVQPMRMNPLAHPYISHGISTAHGFHPAPRFSILREPEQSQVVRSPLLEEFRMNSKTNRRFELKDIYNYVVEFSGDQHGSRFIQQKLETANSDEKEQIFKEIQPNLLQLMTDVFGNYVIQKMFEHGNQSQKKILANQMKGHVLHLSMQMYGCRVVQKAFEHVLTDQQASLVKELDGPNLQILKVVKDQNGNHVVQKAIERIPGEYIQFIVDAHRGQMAKMSTHQYGCRVVQRMLEFCQPKAKRVILDELLDHILQLVSDSYGNYVVQHIIQNGEPRDRRQVVNIVLQQLLTFSKHKFASNIVEKSIDCADEDQRTEILRGLTAPNEQGLTPVLGLMRDQYGNYVLQKVYSQLQGADLLALEADMKHSYPYLKRTSYGKQVIAIEKLLFGANGPPTATSSSRSSILPSTNASSTADGDATSPNQADSKAYRDGLSSDSFAAPGRLMPTNKVVATNSLSLHA